MKKILFAAMAAIIVCGMFAGLNIMTVRSAIANGMAMNPTELVYDPPYGGPLTFDYPINITATPISVSAWQAKLLWNPAILRALGVVWGTFMGAGATYDSYTVSSGGEYIILGQSYKSNVNSTGSGWLANVTFTFVLPGATFVNFQEAKVWNDTLYEFSLLGNSYSGRVKSDRPHPVFSWKTDDGMNPLPAKNSTYTPPTRSIGTGQIYDGGRLVQVPGSATIVHFNASASYDVSHMTWNGSAYNLVGGAGLATYAWDFGDGGTGTGITVDHQYLAYNKTGWLVTLNVTDDDGVYWMSTWRYQGPDPSNTVPMWRDVGVVDIWPSLAPYYSWDKGNHNPADDWWNAWSYDSTDFWLPNTADRYWNYNLSDSFCDVNTGYGVTSPDYRLWPNFTGYAEGSRVKPTDADVGLPLIDLVDYNFYRVYRSDGTTAVSVLYYINDVDAGASMYFDADGSGGVSSGDSIIGMSRLCTSANTTDGTPLSWVFNSTLGDTVTDGPGIANGTALSFFSWGDSYNDVNSNLQFDAGEWMYWDEADATGSQGTVSGDPNPTVKQGYEDFGVGALYVLVTANNYGSVTENCRITLYAVGVALKTTSTYPDYTPVQVTSVEQIGLWTTKIRGGAGTGWGLEAHWLPSKNMTYVLFATIDIADASTFADQKRSDNYYVLNKPVSNIANFNRTSYALVPAGWVNNAYLCDLSNAAGTGSDGRVTSADLNFLLNNNGALNPTWTATGAYTPISKP